MFGRRTNIQMDRKRQKVERIVSETLGISGQDPSIQVI